MTGMESISLTIPAALLLGLAFGAGPCNLTCLPYLGPAFLATDETAQHAWRTVLPFSAGRLTGYTSLGLVAGYLGSSLQSWFQSPVVGWVLGGATIVVGVSLLWKRRNTTKPVQSVAVDFQVNHVVEVKKSCLPKRSLPGGLFVMGAGMALNPCAPLGTVLIAASATGSAVAGLTLGLGFGVGAVVIPAFVFGIGVAHFGRQLRNHMEHWRSGMEVVACGLLIVMGIVTALGLVRP